MNCIDLIELNWFLELQWFYWIALNCVDFTEFHWVYSIALISLNCIDFIELHWFHWTALISLNCIDFIELHWFYWIALISLNFHFVHSPAYGYPLSLANTVRWAVAVSASFRAKMLNFIDFNELHWIVLISLNCFDFIELHSISLNCIQLIELHWVHWIALISQISLGLSYFPRTMVCLSKHHKLEHLGVLHSLFSFQ